MKITSMTVSRKGICTIVHNYMPDDNDMYVDEIGHIITEPTRKQRFERGNYCIHYCIRGKAVVNGITVGEGEGYVLPPMCKIQYISDEKEPYEYAWIIIGGIKAKYFLRGCGFSGKFEIFKNDKIKQIARTIKDACYISYDDKNLNLYFMSILFNIMSFHKQSENIEMMDKSIDSQISGSEYVLKAIDYIRENYAGNFDIERLAHKCHISQNYLCRLFNRIVGCTPQAYVAGYRMEIAKKVLSETDWNITETAECVGYTDPQHFSQVFRKYTGTTPSKYRKEMHRR